MKKICKNYINLNDVITCGQIFRYFVTNDKYTLILSDRVVELYEDNKYIYATSNNETNLENILINFLDLNRDYEKINQYLINNDNSLKTIIESCKGFKIINSPSFEMIISYMISANNNVRNITRAVNNLSEKYGKEIIFNDKKYYLFPSLDDMKKLNLEDYINLKLGFRSKYIYDFVKNINEEDINKINELDTISAIKYLTSFNGIGLKIASCILLFGYKRLDVFPIDTWVKKYMMDNYGFADINKIKEYATNKYGEYSGLAIQYMFHSKRNKALH